MDERERGGLQSAHSNDWLTDLYCAVISTQPWRPCKACMHVPMYNVQITQSWVLFFFLRPSLLYIERIHILHHSDSPYTYAITQIRL